MVVRYPNELNRSTAFETVLRPSRESAARYLESVRRERFNPKHVDLERKPGYLEMETIHWTFRAFPVRLEGDPRGSEFWSIAFYPRRFPDGDRAPAFLVAGRDLAMERMQAVRNNAPEGSSQIVDEGNFIRCVGGGVWRCCPIELGE